ncbi:hypothetical protein [Microbispora sp. GKU 823]|uniref:hypothetical protein n=1 Tax=Microbispora sp. GKU 823 TaxID=1652100 RepID=UPI001C4E0F5A|nr:hypothetical protein [Microbispora sp. GKU 823]
MTVRPTGFSVLRAGRGSFLLHRRATLVATLLGAALAVAAVVYLCVGESFVGPGEVVRVLAGQPSPDEFVVGTLRMPRLVVGLLAAPPSASPDPSSRPWRATRSPVRT